jgi:hypothetical protein
MTAKRKMVAGDLAFDPTYAEQREVARLLLGACINAMEGGRLIWQDAPDLKKLAAMIKERALRDGVVWYDEWHHAPKCNANNWSKQMLPQGPCTCGAERREIR